MSQAIDEGLDRIASNLVEAAEKDGATLDQKLNVFRALLQYKSLTSKRPKKGDDGDDGESDNVSTFDRLRANLRAVDGHEEGTDAAA